MTEKLDTSSDSEKGFLGSDLFRRSLLVVMVLAQLLVPAWMILGREQVLARGEVYRFQTRPVDPYDAFRGRYVALGYQVAAVPVPMAEGQDLAGGRQSRGQTVYVELGRDAEGFAQLVALHLQRPEGVASLKAKVQYSAGQGEGATIRLPFDRYYLPEHIAPEAERVYRERSRSEPEDAWVDVRVLDGRGVLEELYVGGKPILDFIRQQEP